MKPESNQAPTILDVADRAGVSKSTVSRVLNAGSGSKSPYADVVRKAADELGYRRDMFASAMRRGRTGLIGVIVPRLTDTAMAMFYEAVAEQSLAVGKHALVATSGTDVGLAEAAARSLLDRRVDGLILATDRQGDETSRMLRDAEVPVVCALRTESSGPAVVGDDENGAFMATKHLIELGHSKIAFLNGPVFASNARGRLSGFIRAHAAYGLNVDYSLIKETDFTTSSAAIQMTRILEQDRHVSACFTVTDNVAVGAISALTRAGLSVPEDVSIVGYNDIPLAKHLPVPLTTVRVPFGEIARLAIEQLDVLEERIAVVPPTLIIRDSTAAPRERGGHATGN